MNAISTDELSKLAHSETSTAKRLGLVALLLVAAGGAVAMGTLLVTEASLPVRTQVAFGLLSVICSAWAMFAAWVLTTRRPLLAQQDVIAGRMAVGFAALFTVGAAAIGFGTGQPGAFGAAAMGVAMLVIAVGVLRRAHRRRAALLARRDELQRLLARQSA